MSRHPNAQPFKILGAKQEARVACATTPKSKTELREQIARQTEEFLADGGRIKAEVAGVKFTRSHREARVDDFGR
ncbi:hypothetical protein [uncultured Marinobacter sp.]|uniref:hypothetical protein n=1 Tax=uncultured Marinobacter sp. TaxID=187379 RepID=UPI00259110A4|nr:hypothetical protein [uncultured Marinobacter sp.]